MKKEIIITAKTVEQAVEIGAQELKMQKEDVSFEVLESPKKGFLGLGASEAKVKITGKLSAVDIAAGFLGKIVKHMQLDAEVKILDVQEYEIRIEITGEGLGSLIGYHGEVLDSLQYLTYLAVNKGDSDSADNAENTQTETTEGAVTAGEEDGGLSGTKTDKTEMMEMESEADVKGGETKETKEIKERKNAVKISIDIENYRAKREETLKGLAKKMADRVLRYGRSVTLEPMNAYERRVIHAAIQEIEGVATNSIGMDGERKVIISRDSRDNKDNRDGRDRPPFRTQRGDGFSTRKPPPPRR